MKRAAIYARVSTNNGQDPEVQLAEIREFCMRREWTTVKEYVDKGISGSKERRPALDNLLADCRRRAVDCVVVYRYDRFARSLRQSASKLSSAGRCSFAPLIPLLTYSFTVVQFRRMQNWRISANCTSGSCPLFVLTLA